MANGDSRTVGSWEVAGRAPAETTGPLPPLSSYRAALERYETARLRAIQAALGVQESSGRTAPALAVQIAEHLGNPRTAEALLARLGPPSRQALGLFALTESASWPWSGLSLALECLGVDPTESTRVLVELGVLAVAAEPPGIGERPTPLDPVERIERPSAGLTLVAHPAALSASRTVLPAGDPPMTSGPVRMVREADGLEPVLRLAALWQRVAEMPLRQTQQGTLYKRDRERIEDDPALAGPIADMLEPLPDMSALWLALARAIGLVVPDPGGDRAVAARPEFWAEHAVHLPQMIASRWLGLRQWHEQGGIQQEGISAELALPYLRPVLLLWLAALRPDDWVAIDDLSAHLGRLSTRWDRATLDDPSLAPDPTPGPPPSTSGARPRPSRKSRPEPEAGRNPGAGATPAGMEAGVIESLLLGAAYQLGLVRTAEEAAGGRRVVQISPLGRYVLALGPPPPPRPNFEHFLFVQPNFEIIAYRQGLTPALIGGFSRFAQWSQIGAAMALKLTADSVYRGLEGGLTEQSILDRLARHSQRALPAGVAEALRTWSDRRRRVSYYSAATLIEFANAEDLEQGLKLWPAEGPAPLRVAARLVLVEGDDRAIPYGRFRIAGSRSYRSDPEACIDVEPDGITLTLDLGRSDLLVDAELARFAEELSRAPSRGEPGNPRRRFVVTPATLARAVDNGLSPGSLAHWYKKRTGADIPPAVRLLLLANDPPGPLPAHRPMVLRAPSSQWLDGLLQHPATRDLLGERLGPTAVVIPDGSLAPFRRALEGLGLAMGIEPTR